MLLLEDANVRRRDEIRCMAISTAELAVFLDQLEPGESVIEARRVHVDDRHVAPTVLRMATSAGPLADSGVVAFLPGETSPQRLVTVQALRLGSSRLLQVVTAGALEKAFQVSVRGGKLAGRDKLAARLSLRDERRER